MTAKVTDFAFSKKNIEGSYYKEGQNVKHRPIKNAAPEAISYRAFTRESDVWSFAVTMWEAFSYGVEPFAALTPQQAGEVIMMCKNAMPLERPDKCPVLVYELMMTCWAYARKQRPSCKVLVNQLKTIHADLVDQGEMECPRCHSKKTLVVEMQTRSADEGFTYYIHCFNPKCNKVTKT